MVKHGCERIETIGDAYLAVWNASLNYAEAKEWDSVYVAYNYFIDKYNGKKNEEGVDLAAISLFNLGMLVTDTLLTKYSQEYNGPLLKSKKENSEQAAVYYERFYKEYPNFLFGETDLTKRAVNDAAFFYQQAENWESAIRMNRIYIDKYSFKENEESNVSRLREMAKIYIRLGKEVDAFKIYDELGRKYPNAPFAVEGFYERAKYFLNKGDLNQAKVEYEKCYRTGKKLRDSGKEDFGRFYVSEALYYLTELDREVYNSIKLKGSNKNALTAAKQLKEKEWKRLIGQYDYIIELGQKEYGHALIRKAMVIENYANEIFYQERFKSVSSIEDLALEDAICFDSKAAYGFSIELYISAISQMDDFVKIYN